jgi:hypothetical protein
MAIPVEINLRVPDINVRIPAPPRRIFNGDVRFWKAVDLETLPKVGDVLELSTRTVTFRVTVKRVGWHDDRNGFVVDCHYGQRSMPPEEYDSLKADLDWTMKPLLSGV